MSENIVHSPRLKPNNNMNQTVIKSPAFVKFTQSCRSENYSEAITAPKLCNRKHLCRQNPKESQSPAQRHQHLHKLWETSKKESGRVARVYGTSTTINAARCVGGQETNRTDGTKHKSREKEIPFENALLCIIQSDTLPYCHGLP